MFGCESVTSLGFSTGKGSRSQVPTSAGAISAQTSPAPVQDAGTKFVLNMKMQIKTCETRSTPVFYTLNSLYAARYVKQRISLLRASESDWQQNVSICFNNFERKRWIEILKTVLVSRNLYTVSEYLFAFWWFSGGDSINLILALPFKPSHCLQTLSVIFL